MKKLIVLVLMVVISKPAFAQPISSAGVFPEPAFPSDILTVGVDGDLWATNHIIEYTNFSQADNILTLDMYWGYEGIGMPVVLPYSYWESIGMFSSGDYILNVNSYFWGNYDFETTSFTVIPEPCSFVLFSLGGLVLLRRVSIGEYFN